MVRKFVVLFVGALSVGIAAIGSHAFDSFGPRDMGISGSDFNRGECDGDGTGDADEC